MENNFNINQENTKSKISNRSKVVFILLILLLCGLIYAGWMVFNVNYRSELTAEAPTITKSDPSFSDELAAEEALRFLDEAEEIKVTGPMSAEIVSPEGDSFVPSQARMYEARITNFPKNAKGECQWNFYLNQYDEEELYQQQTTRVIGDYCKFTTTFIKDPGELRVEVKIVATDRTGETTVAETVAERKYLVH